MAETNENLEKTNEQPEDNELIKNLRKNLDDKEKELRQYKIKDVFNSFKSKGYPIDEVKDKAMSLIEKGVSPEDAILRTLHEENKLIREVKETPKEAPSEENLPPARSATIVNLTDSNKDPKSMSDEELYAALKEEEAKGNILWRA
jgi:hypothetical protein